jgi:hypothetical protein
MLRLVVGKRPNADQLGHGAFPPDEQREVITLVTSKTSEHDCVASQWSLDDLAVEFSDHQRFHWILDTWMATSSPASSGDSLGLDCPVNQSQPAALASSQNRLKRCCRPD